MVGKIVAFWIIGKAGMLVYRRDFEGSFEVPEMYEDSVGTTLYTLLTLAGEIRTSKDDINIINRISTDRFTIDAIQTATGLSLVAFSTPDFFDPRGFGAQPFLREVYSSFQLVAQNPFSPPDQPIHASRFDAAVMHAMQNAVRNVK